MSLKIDRQTPSSPFFHQSDSNQFFTKSCQFIPPESEPTSPVTLNHCPKRAQKSLNMLIDDPRQLQKDPSTLNSKSSLFIPVALHPTPTNESTQEICSSNESPPKLCKIYSSGTFSTLRSKLMQSNQYIAGLYTRYTSQINNLQKISKNYKQKLSQYNGEIEEVKLQNNKKVRELVQLKQRLQLLQQENNNLRIRIKECQSEKKKLQVIILQKDNDENKDETQDEKNKRRHENRQRELRAIIDSMAAGMIDLQRQKQRVQFELNRERSMHGEDAKAWEEEMTEQKRLADHEKENMLKRINKLQNKLKEKVQRLSLLENGQRQMHRSIQLQKDKDERMRFQVQQLTYELHSLKKLLTFAESSLSSTHKQIKTLAIQNQQIRHLKGKIAEKDELIAILRNKITALQIIIQQLQNKCSELQEQIHVVAQDKIQLQEDKKDLMQKIQYQKQSITKLISQVQFFQNTSEIMNTEFIKKSTYIERQKEQLSMVNQQIEKNNEELQFKLKVIQEQLAEEQEKSNSVGALASELRSKNYQLTSEISKLNIERLSLAQTLAKLTEETSGIDHKKSMLESQIFQLKSKKQMKESFFFEKIEELSKQEQHMFEQIDSLNRQLTHLCEKIDRLSKENGQLTHQCIVKERELQQAIDEIVKMRKDKYKIEQKLEAFQCQALSNQVKLYEQTEQIQRLNKYIEDLQSHINDLDNILVWNFEEGRGESNNFEERKTKMQQIVILLQQKMKEIEELKKQCKEKDEQIEELDNTIGESQNLLAKFTEKLQNFLEEKENLTRMIEDIDHGNKALIEKLASYKVKEVQWTNKETSLSKKLKSMEEQMKTTNQQKNKSQEKLELLSKQVQEKLKEIEEMSLQIASQKGRNIILKESVEKLSFQLVRTDKAAVKKAKELSKQIDALKAKFEEKRVYLNQIQSDNKQQVNFLTAQLISLKNEIRDFCNFYQSEKLNYTKRNLLLVDLGTNLTKLQKTNCIKSHLTHPIKDILRKMEQLDNYSSKLFAKYDKFQGKKEF